VPGGDEPEIVFGPYRMDRRNRSLTREGVAVPLGGRAFDTLAVLAAASGATVGKEALLDAVWPGLTVEENNLQVQISALRKALGEGWIVTVPSRGYRLAPPSSATSSERSALEVPDKPSIAVLPFANLSSDAEQEYFADGMVEEIITGLSRVRSFFVIARNSSFSYKGKSPDVRQVGRELGVRYVLEGSVRKAGNRVRITGQLADATTGAHIWADRFDGTLEDIFDLQDRVTAGVVTAIQPRILSAEIERAAHKPTENLQAYDLVLRALPHFESDSRERFEEAGRLLRQATEIDPTCASAFVMLAHYKWGLMTQGWVQRTKAASSEIVRLTKIALEHGAEDPEVLARASFLIAVPGGDLGGGIALAEKSLALNPNSILALTRGGQLHAYAGDSQTAIDLLERAARLDPVGRSGIRNLAFSEAHFIAGRHEAVLEFTEKALRELPDLAGAMRRRAASLGLLGRTEEGRQVVQQLLAIAPDWTVSRVRAFYEIDMNNVQKSPGVVDAMCEGLRRAGLPE
jgi:TolB-like protein